MTERVIPIADERQRRITAMLAPAGGHIAAPVLRDGALHDARGRPLHDLRISVTDRCNFRCSYCMPREVFGKDHAFLPHAALLSFEEISRLAGIFVGLGVRKLRLTETNNCCGAISKPSSPSSAVCASPAASRSS